MSKQPLAMKTIAVPDCQVGEDVVFSQDNRRWFLTCMGSQAMIEGDAQADKPIRTVKLSKPYPHGIAIHDGIDRILVTSTVRAGRPRRRGRDHHRDRGKHRQGAGQLQGLEEGVAGGRSPGRDPVRARRQDASGLRHQHVRRLSGARPGTRRRRASTSPWRTTFPRRRPGYRWRFTSARSPT